MKPVTLAGLLAGAAVLAVGGIAAAARRKTAPGTEPPYFVYTAQEGDTLSALALKLFGDAAKWPALYDGLEKPTGGKGMLEWEGKGTPPLLVGARIHVPCQWTTVEKGESLATVAKRTLGDAGRWRRIYEANRKALPDPDKIGVGQRLAVPIEAVPQPTASLGCDLDMLGAELL
jgi:LysM repeat protein